MKIVISGPKGSGKTATGEALGKILGLPVVETDRTIESLYAEETGQQFTCRQIHRTHGEDRFREWERKAVVAVANHDWRIVVTGGGTLMDGRSRALLRNNAMLIHLTASDDVLWDRATAGGIPPWLEGPDGRDLFATQNLLRNEVMQPFADLVLSTDDATPATLAEQAAQGIESELAVRCRAANTYGDVIRVTTFGESHGKAIGAVMEGLRPGIEISEDVIMEQMNRRKPGQSKITTTRKEDDLVHLLSGVFEGKTTGAPIAMVIYNQDQRSKNYDDVKNLFRPGHADYTFYQKYGLRDHRGGGRSSGRETATRVAAGAVARDILLKKGVTIVAYAVEIAGIQAETCDYDVIEKNPCRAADLKAAKAMEEAIIQARKDQNSVGGIIQLDVTGLPPGLGDPVFGKLDARLTYAIMTIGAIKGVEVGGGFALCRLRGDASNDEMSNGDFVSNNAGGILGGISNGAPIVLRVAVKPTASISQEQRTVNTAGENVPVETHGRHDPCIVPRAVPVIENMAALVLLDAWEIQSRIRPDWEHRL